MRGAAIGDASGFTFYKSKKEARAIRESLKDYCARTGRTELLKQRHPTKNRSLTPDSITFGSGKKIWRRWGKGHAWQVIVKSRSSGVGCLICAGSVNLRRDQKYRQMLAEADRSHNRNIKHADQRKAKLPKSICNSAYVTEKSP